jgi:hypothetical protein
LLKIEKLPLLNATKWFGPAAPIVSGGSIIPASAFVWLRVIVVKFAPVLNVWACAGPVKVTTIAAQQKFARANLIVGLAQPSEAEDGVLWPMDWLLLSGVEEGYVAGRY